jgi:hypothetical protein
MISLEFLSLGHRHLNQLVRHALRVPWLLCWPWPVAGFSVKTVAWPEDPQKSLGQSETAEWQAILKRQ